MKEDIERGRRLVLDAVDLLFDACVVPHSGHGNLSARLRGERMILTGQGNLRTVEESNLAIVSFDGQVLEGEVEPGVAQVIPMHAAIYRLRAEAGAVIHTHSASVTAFAVAGKPLPVAYEPLLRFGIDEPVPVAEWAPRGSEEAVASLLSRLEPRPMMPAVLLGNHGLLAFGRDPLEAAQLVVTLEEAAQVALDAVTLGGAKPLPEGAPARERERLQAAGSKA